MKKSILMSALLLCISLSVFGQEDELKTIAEIKSEKDKKTTINKKEAKRILKEEKKREKHQHIPPIKNDIKEKFLEWAKKGEFESSKEHFERIQNERVKKLHQVITDGFKRRMDNMRIEIDLGTYNADEKIYPITINITPFYDPTSFFNNYKISVKEKIPFERGEEAIEFKRDIESESYNFLKRDPDNWFVKDGFLFPINMEYENRLIKIFDKGDYPFFSEYVFNTDDLGLSEYFPENYTFTLEDVEEEEEIEDIKDIPRIEDYIKKKFLRWTKKEEFKSNKGHFERIQSEQLNKLRQVITDGFKRRMNNMGINIKLGEYNADEKIYPITITLTKWNEDRSTGRQFIIKTNVPFEKEEAITFKKAIEKEEYGYRFSKEDPDNWFVQDGFLFPIYVEYEGGIFKKIFNKGDYPLFSEYVFNTDDLGLSEYFPKNFTFTLKDVIQEDELKLKTAAELKAAKEEAERKEQREKAKDIPRIKNDIKNEFLRWAKKEEFESSKEHFERIQSERVKKLHELTAYTFEHRAKPMIHIKLGEYNADEKIYPITIELTFYPPSSHSYSISVEKNIPLEREEAANLKNYIFDNKFAAIEYRLEKDPNNWFVKDGFLFPINLEYRAGILKNIFDKENYPLFSEYVFNTDDLGLSEYFPENYTFTLGDYIKSLKEKQKNN